MIELKDKSVEMLVELDEPEALLETIRRTAARKTGKRWRALTTVLDEASLKLDQLLNAKPAGPDFRPHDGEPGGGEDAPLTDKPPQAA